MWQRPWVVPVCTLLSMCCICPNAEQPEGRAQQVLAFRQPRDRLDMQRMQRKECRDCRTPPDMACHATENREYQQRVGCMKCQIDQMMMSSVQAEQLTVE